MVHRPRPARPLPLEPIDPEGWDKDPGRPLALRLLALLGALSLGDIGLHFPPEDPRWKGADSLVLLEQVVALVQQRGWQVVNLDTVVVAERPRLKPHIEAMRSNIARRLGIEADRVGVKATTNEGLGPTGREEGIACHAVALLQQP